jgi:hypothetical protein
MFGAPLPLKFTRNPAAIESAREERRDMQSGVDVSRMNPEGNYQS